MRIHYGPPGAKGVTTLMAVGDSELSAGPTMRTGAGVAAGVWLLGVLTGSRTMRNLGLGGAVALLVADRVQRQRISRAAAAVAPTPASGYFIG